MEEIKANEYVRTKEGYIARVKEIDNKAQAYWFDNCILKISGICCYDLHFEATNYIVKHSPNIIDLIECGDYVNGYKVSFIAQDCAKFVQCDYPVETGTANHYKFYKESIKDVVTKEQFEQMKYIVGDESNVKD